MENLELLASAKKRHETVKGDVLAEYELVIEQEKEIRYYRSKIDLLEKELSEAKCTRTIVADSIHSPETEQEPIEASPMINVEVECGSIFNARAALEAFKNVDNLHIRLRIIDKL